MSCHLIGRQRPGEELCPSQLWQRPAPKGSAFVLAAQRDEPFRPFSSTQWYVLITKVVFWRLFYTNLLAMWPRLTFVLSRWSAHLRLSLSGVNPVRPFPVGGRFARDACSHPTLRARVRSRNPNPIRRNSLCPPRPKCATPKRCLLLEPAAKKDRKVFSTSDGYVDAKSNRTWTAWFHFKPANSKA